MTNNVNYSCTAMAWRNFSPLPAIISCKSQGKQEQWFTISFCTHGHGLSTIKKGLNSLNGGESHCGSNLSFFLIIILSRIHFLFFFNK